MSAEIRLQTITAGPHHLIESAAGLFAREVYTPFPAILAGEGYRLYVATQDDRLVGAANVCENRMDGLGYIRKIAVEPPYRNQGIGSALLRSVIDDMQDLGRPRLAICPMNEGNRRLYARLRFAKDPAEKMMPNWMFLDLPLSTRPRA